MLSIIAYKNTLLNQKIEIVTKRSTKDKVLSYLSTESNIHNSTEFNIPFNRQQLADYLAVDRSALSTTLSKLQSDGLISFKKNHFVLLKELKI